MAHSLYHAKSSEKRFAGNWKDYLPLHQFLDGSKIILADPRHRSLYHHDHAAHILGPLLFGNHMGPAKTPTEIVAQLHLIEDLGQVLSPGTWISEPPNYLKDEPSKIQERFANSLKSSPINPHQIELLLKGLLPKTNSPAAILYLTAVGPFLAENILRSPCTITPENKEIPIRPIIETAIKDAFQEDLIPSFQDLLQNIPIQPWMYKKARHQSLLL